ncbi:hypothetical protein, partial [Gordonia aichiensis]
MNITDSLLFSNCSSAAPPLAVRRPRRDAVRSAIAALRRAAPELDRPFRVPGGDVIPVLAFV